MKSDVSLDLRRNAQNDDGPWLRFQSSARCRGFHKHAHSDERVYLRSCHDLERHKLRVTVLSGHPAAKDCWAAIARRRTIGQNTTGVMGQASSYSTLKAGCIKTAAGIAESTTLRAKVGVLLVRSRLHLTFKQAMLSSSSSFVVMSNKNLA